MKRSLMNIKKIVKIVTKLQILYFVTKERNYSFIIYAVIDNERYCRY